MIMVVLEGLARFNLTKLTRIEDAMGRRYENSFSREGREPVRAKKLAR